MLDRVVRGRTWIALLGLMLAGIVAMQVEVLKLGASEGRALQQSAAMQSRNEILRASVASESADQRIEQLAASRYGMVMPAPAGIGFLPPNATENAIRAARNIAAPDPTTFLASLAAVQSQTPPSTSTGTTVATSTPTTSSDATGTSTDTSTATDTSSTTPTTGDTTGDTTVPPTTNTTPVAPVTPVAPTTDTSGTTAPSTTATGTGGAAVSGG